MNVPTYQTPAATRSERSHGCYGKLGVVAVRPGQVTDGRQRDGATEHGGEGAGRDEGGGTGRGGSGARRRNRAGWQSRAAASVRCVPVTALLTDGVQLTAVLSAGWWGEAGGARSGRTATCWKRGDGV